MQCPLTCNGRRKLYFNDFNSTFNFLFMKLKILFLWALLLPGAVSSFAQVASGECGENLTWMLEEDGTLTISGTGTMTDYTYYAPWRSYAFRIITVIIENGVTSIGNGAFSECRNLTSVTIPESVTSIENDAFHNCYSLTSVTIPGSVTSIGNDAFYYCSSLTSVTIPESVTRIGNYAFYNCRSLTSIEVL
jgi:hypothetical protein